MAGTHTSANRYLFGLVFGIVVSIPFILHGCSSDDGGSVDPMTVARQQIAIVVVDPYTTQANDLAASQGRPTTIADVAAFIPGGSQNPQKDAQNVYTVYPDKVTVAFPLLGNQATCTVTIDTGKAVDHG